MRLLDPNGKILLNSSGARETGNGSGNYSCCCGNGSGNGNCSLCANCYTISAKIFETNYSLTNKTGCGWSDSSENSISIIDGNWTIILYGEIVAYNSLNNGTCPPADGWTSTSTSGETYTVEPGCPCTLAGNCSTCSPSFFVTWYPTGNPDRNPIIAGNATIVLDTDPVSELCNWGYQGSNWITDPSVKVDCGGAAWGFLVSYSPYDGSGPIYATLGPNQTGCPPTGTYFGYGGVYGLIPYTIIISELMMMRPPEVIPEGFDVNKEKLRLQQGGCCGGGKR